MRRAAAYLICIALICTGYLYSRTLDFPKQEDPEVLTRGVVLEVKEIAASTPGGEAENLFNEKEWAVRVKINSGLYKGRVVDTIHYQGNHPSYDFMVYPGDEVVLSLELDNYVLKDAYITGLARDKYLLLLFLVFVVSILLIGARQGFKTILSLVVTGWAIIKILLPAILAGKDPILITIIICAGITVITHMLISGPTRKALAAITGTVAGVFLGGILAKYIIILTRINGLGSEDSRLFYFSFAEGKIDLAGLLFAGIVIGSLGAVMDVAMSIASSVSEICRVNPGLSFRQLAKSGLNVGRDIIGTMANTLILAYTGSALPLMLLLLANDIPYLKYINLDLIATEVVRALAGSIGLFMAVPFTALVAAALCKGAFSVIYRR